MDKSEVTEKFLGFCPASQAESDLTRHIGDADLTVDGQTVTVWIWSSATTSVSPTRRVRLASAWQAGQKPRNISLDSGLLSI